MNFLDKQGLSTFLAQLKKIFGYKSVLDETMNIRRQYLLEIDYANTLAFDTSVIIGGSATSAVCGIAVAGAVIVGNS